MNNARLLSGFLDASSITTNTNITILRDSTEAGDAIPLLQHLIRTLSASFQFPKHRIIYLATRTRASFTASDDHIYPTLSRMQTTALSLCTPIDAYALASDSYGHDAARKLLESLRETVKGGGVVMIECLHSLKFVFGINPAAFVRTVSSLNGNLSVFPAAPIGCGVDEEVTSVVEISDTVLDLTDLQTGFAIDVDGMIRVSRQKGRWLMQSVARRYKITEGAFNIYT